jgi:hypothetical protein
VHETSDVCLQAMLYASLMGVTACYMVGWLIFSKGYLAKSSNVDVGMLVWTSASSNFSQTSKRFAGSDGVCGCNIIGNSDFCQNYSTSIPGWGNFDRFACLSLPPAYTRQDASELFIPVALRVRSRFVINFPGLVACRVAAATISSSTSHSCRSSSAFACKMLFLAMQPTALLQEVTSLGVMGYAKSFCPETFSGRNLSHHRGSACWYSTTQHWLNTEADSLVVGIDHVYKGSGAYSPQPCRIRHAVTGELTADRFSCVLL